MESTTLNTKRLVWITAITGLCITLVAFQKQKTPETKQIPQSFNTDTIPKKKELKIRDLDEALEDLDDADINVKIDLGDLHKELAKIGPEVEKAVAQARINVADAIKDIDVTAITKEVNAALKEIDCVEINREVKAAIDGVDWEKIKKEIDEIKELKLDKIHVDMEKVNAELKKIQPELNEKLANVKVEIEKAKKEIKEYKEFVNGLNHDGLIDKKGEYTIKHKNGELIINGKVQPEEVYNKYRSFLEKHKTLAIEKSDDDFNIDID
jgi:hypothetical protein